MTEHDGNEVKKRKHPLIKDVKKMLREQNLDCDSPEVVAKLTFVAENMALELLKDACYYSNKNDDNERAKINKSDIELAIKMRNEEVAEYPNEDAVIDAAVAVNGNPLCVKENYGVALPKENLANCNYQLQNPDKKTKTDTTRQHNRQCYTFLMPFKNYKPSGSGNINNFIFKNPIQGQIMRNINEVPMKITITPKYSSMPSPGTSSTLKKN